MSRRSAPQYKLDEQRFPVRVRIVIPPGGFGTPLDAMHVWLTARCGRDGYGLWSEAGRGYPDATLVYLADLETAATFVAAFRLGNCSRGWLGRGCDLRRRPATKGLAREVRPTP